MNAITGASVKRAFFLVHRWTGIAMCVLMALWFVSGVVMLFVGYPKFTPWERMAALPALSVDGCCIAPAQALARSAAPASVKGLTLTTVGGRASYVLHEGDGALRAIDGATGVRLDADGAAALAAARAYRPGDKAAYQELVHEDRWTHARGLQAHRPLHVVELDDADATRVYVSSATGQVVMDAPRAERAWNLVGAWLHWLYMVRDRPVDPVWSWTVIALSAAGVVSATTGVANGLWRWRFAGRYKSGAKTPYRDAAMRWHHMLGLLFGAVVFTWIVSGLMSMNPLGVFDTRGARPDVAAYQGGSPATARLPLDAAAIVALLDGQRFRAAELEWRVLGGVPYVLARDSGNATRLVVAQGDAYAVLERWPQDRLERAAASLLAAPLVSATVLTHYDSHFYGRGSASMYGANERRLPALRLVYGDRTQTWVHVDMATGRVELSVDAWQRAGRWLFNFLHSWDVPPLLAGGWLRDAILIALSAGGLLLCATAAVIGWRRMCKPRKPRTLR